MALFQIGNEQITIQVDSMGAEMKSLKKTATRVEYMWEGNPAFWKRTSPVLFPIVGGLRNGEYIHNEKSYPMGQHGFARDMEFKLKSQAATEVWFTLQSDEDTLAKYPYPFILELGYELEDQTVIVKWRVKNPAKEPMHFSIGGHPAFLCPIGEGTKQSDYSLLFDVQEQVISSGLENGLVGEKKTAYKLKNGMLPITDHLFDNDALVIEHDQAHSVALVKPDGKPYLTVTFDTPLFGIWSPPKKNAPFICIEPWYGRCDRAGYAGEWKDREWMQVLNSEETFAADYRVIIE